LFDDDGLVWYFWVRLANKYVCKVPPQVPAFLSLVSKFILPSEKVPYSS
jgi:hypothetical protein